MYLAERNTALCLITWFISFPRCMRPRSRAQPLQMFRSIFLGHLNPTMTLTSLLTTCATLFYPRINVQLCLTVIPMTTYAPLLCSSVRASTCLFDVARRAFLKPKIMTSSSGSSSNRLLLSVSLFISPGICSTPLTLILLNLRLFL
jgi:hypothetical protein